MMTINDYKAWLHDLLTMGIPAISTDNCAKILAVLYHMGNNERMTHDTKFLADIEYIQERFHIKGGEIPDPELAELFRDYVKDLEEYSEEHKEERFSENGAIKCVAPEWAVNLFRNRYGMKLI